MTIKDETNNGLKIEGDLGDLQVVEESTDSEDCDDTIDANKQIVPDTRNFPTDLVQASTQQAIGSVTVSNSENVQFGNNTYFNGPVTIKQVVQPSEGIDNSGYEKSKHDTSPTLGRYQAQPEDPTFQKYLIRNWITLLIWGIGILLLISIFMTAVLVYTSKSRINSQDPTQAFNEVYENGNESVVMGLTRYHAQIFISVALVLQTSLLLISRSLLTPYDHANGSGEGGNTASLSENELAGDLVVAPGHLRIVSRTDWLAQPVEKPLTRLRLPAPWVIITHTATPSCFTQSKCVLRVRLIQTFHIESRDWFDIGYNFLVGGDGSAYVGRGWDYEGAHTKGYNKYSIAIAFIGTFNTETPTKYQVQACMKLINQGVAEGKLAKDYKIFGHRQFMSTLSPGDKVFDIIKTWPHFVNTTLDTDFSKLLPKY